MVAAMAPKYVLTIKGPGTQDGTPYVCQMVRVLSSVSGQVLANAPTDYLRNVQAVKRHLRSLYNYPVALQQLLHDEKVLDGRALLNESIDLQLAPCFYNS